MTDPAAGALVAVDLATGDRSVLSGAGAGAGPAFGGPVAVALDEPGGRALVLDPELGAVIAVDLATGDRTPLPAEEAGPGLERATAIAYDALRERVVLADPFRGGLLALDAAGAPEAGGRVVFSR